MRNIYYYIFLILFYSLFSLPQNPEVLNGESSFSKEEKILNINQSTERSIIKWDDFSILENETVNFNLPQTSSSVLNRVIGDNISLIYGKIYSNGKVYLLNEKGIQIGQNGIVNTASFIATTLKIRDEDFLNSNFHFKGESLAKISNEGFLKADRNIYIFAKEIENKGEINSEKIALGASQEIYLFEEGKEDIIVSKVLDGKILNEGNIKSAHI